MMSKELLSTEYTTWRGMKERCGNVNYHRYKDYGERGITVCERWDKSYWDFLADMGRKPTPGHVIDREDNNGNYEPSNCRWVTQSESCRNRRTNKFLTFNGKTQIQIKWAEDLGIANTALISRFKRGWSVERALTTRRIPKKGRRP